MGSSASSQNPNARDHAQHTQKASPLLRANHKHDLILLNSHINKISQILAAASILAIEPPSTLFSLWDQLSGNTSEQNDSDSEDNIVEKDWREYLGRKDRALEYVNLFDDEVVRFLYSWQDVVKLYLKEEEIVEGLLAKDSHALVHLAYAIEMNSKDMATEALAGACVFYSPFEKVLSQDNHQEKATTLPADLRGTQNAMIESTLSSIQQDDKTLALVVSLWALGQVWDYLPLPAAIRCWHYHEQALQAFSTRKKEKERGALKGKEIDHDELVRVCAEKQPEFMMTLRVLLDYPIHGRSIASSILMR